MGITVVTALFLSVWCTTFAYNSERLSESINELLEEPDYGKPLFITPYLLSKQFDKARQLSKVRQLPHAPYVESYSGFLTVNGFYNSNMFFWFFPALNKNKNAPVILWLQGGPGNYGTFGLFVEHGPYKIAKNMSAEFRKHPWNKEFHVIYVDSPVGTGFSFTDVDKGYAKYEIDIANDLYEFLQQFFALFSDYRKNDFYIMGQAYGGKYVPTLASQIYLQGPKARINLKGIAIGNGMLDPEMMMDYSDFLYNLGLVDINQAAVMKNTSSAIIQLIRGKQWYEALVEMDRLIIDFDVFPYPSFFQNYTGYNSYFDFLSEKSPEDYSYFEKYMLQPEFRRAVHIGNLPLNDGTAVQKHLFSDIMQGMREEITICVKQYKSLFYGGQLDLIFPYTSMVNFLRSLKWQYAEQYREAERLIWKVEGKNDIAGYVHNVAGFYEVMVRNAGHHVPYDQSEAALDMITRFINGKPFS